MILIYLLFVQSFQYVCRFCIIRQSWVCLFCMNFTSAASAGSIRLCLHQHHFASRLSPSFSTLIICSTLKFLFRVLVFSRLLYTLYFGWPVFLCLAIFYKYLNHTQHLDIDIYTPIYRRICTVTEYDSNGFSCTNNLNSSNKIQKLPVGSPDAT